MIQGRVTSDLDAIIRLQVRGPAGRERVVNAVVDTGFNGWLSLPQRVIRQLKLPWRRRGRAELADGTETIFDIHEGTVVWDRRVRRIAVDSADTTPLVGMKLMERYELNARVRMGDKVTIRRISSRL
jgi:clan AA aspartic protease